MTPLPLSYLPSKSDCIDDIKIICEERDCEICANFSRRLRELCCAVCEERDGENSADVRVREEREDGESCANIREEREDCESFAHVCVRRCEIAARY